MNVFIMKTVLWTSLFLLLACSALADIIPAKGVASWYGEDHRGRLMANGKRFNPDRLTAASWFYPLGTKVRVTLKTESGITRSVLVTITDRGPSKDLVRDGRIIDLTHAAFRRLGRPTRGLIPVTVEVLD
jgi:rare lipoprotein A